jgi:hypothetical protein
MANVYRTGIRDLGTGVIIWGTSDMYVSMHTSTYTFDYGHDFFNDLTNQITNTGYTAGGNVIDGETTVIDTGNNEVQFDASDETFTALAAGDQPSQVVVYKLVSGPAGADDPLLCRNALTSPPAPNGGDYTIQWDAEGVFEVSNV